MAALGELGPRFVGVTQLPADTADAEIVRLHASGVRAVRFNVRRGGSEHRLHPEMALQERQHVRDDAARGPAVIVQVERVRR